MSRKFSHGSLNEKHDAPSGSDRAFGLTVGGILFALGALKTMLAGAMSIPSIVMIAVGAVLLLLGVAAPALLARPHRLWLRLGAAIAAVVHPIVLTILFALVMTPLAWVMRLAGKRPLQLARDPGAASYWIVPERAAEPQSSMRRQF